MVSENRKYNTYIELFEKVPLLPCLYNYFLLKWGMEDHTWKINPLPFSLWSTRIEKTTCIDNHLRKLPPMPLQLFSSKVGNERPYMKEKLISFC
jgi:hypothetical protein